jgi:hypothetical protein
VPYCPSSREPRVRRGKLGRCKVARNGRQALPQFLAIAPIASIAKGAEPLEAMGLTDHRPGPHYLSALAPPIARSTELIQPAMSRGEIFCLRQSALASRLTRAIKIKDHPGVSWKGPAKG